MIDVAVGNSKIKQMQKKYSLWIILKSLDVKKTTC